METEDERAYVDHAAFMAAYHVECARKGLRPPHEGDYWAWSWRACHSRLWSPPAPPVQRQPQTVPDTEGE